MLEQQHPQHDLGGCARSTMGATARPTTLQSVMDNLQQSLVGKDCVRMAHPTFPQFGNRFADESIPKVALLAAEINHGYASGTSDQLPQHAGPVG
jgi:hypothetical protein